MHARVWCQGVSAGSITGRTGGDVPVPVDSVDDRHAAPHKGQVLVSEQLDIQQHQPEAELDAIWLLDLRVQLQLPAGHVQGVAMFSSHDSWL